MWAVWAVFLTTAAVLLSLGILGLRWRGEQAAVCHGVGQGLLVLSLCTAVFPAALGSAGPPVWAGAYIVLVVVVTGVMTWRAVSRARAKAA